MPLIELGPEDAENGQDIDDNTGNNYTRVEMLFDSLMKEFFEGCNINELIQRMHQDTS